MPRLSLTCRDGQHSHRSCHQESTTLRTCVRTLLRWGNRQRELRWNKRVPQGKMQPSIRSGYPVKPPSFVLSGHPPGARSPGSSIQPPLSLRKKLVVMGRPRGLLNSGNTCFINSIMQALFNLPSVKSELFLAVWILFQRKLLTQPLILTLPSDKTES